VQSNGFGRIVWTLEFFRHLLSQNSYRNLQHICDSSNCLQSVKCGTMPHMKRTSAMFSILVLSILSLSARTMQREMFVSRVVIKELRGPWEIIFGPDGYL